MLNTINGFDLLLIIIITILGFKVYNLTRECESYVGQIMQVSWKLQEETQANETMTTGLTNIMNELIIPLQKLVDHHNGCNCKDCYIRVQPPADLYGCVCNYCTDSDPWLSECQDSIGTPPNTYTDPHLTDPSKCDCDDCWTVHPKF
jgi:hypothetical protein